MNFSTHLSPFIHTHTFIYTQYTIHINNTFAHCLHQRQFADFLASSKISTIITIETVDSHERRYHLMRVNAKQNAKKTTNTFILWFVECVENPVWRLKVEKCYNNKTFFGSRNLRCNFSANNAIGFIVSTVFFFFCDLKSRKKRSWPRKKITSNHWTLRSRNWFAFTRNELSLVTHTICA